MKTVNADELKQDLDRVIAEVAASHEPVQVAAASSRAVLVSEDDWRAMQETLFLVSIPGMRDSIREGLSTPIEDCDSEPNW
ncbi:MAG: type II toxin-antitoxin system Phd/YefM family antitoxin [Candidatus Hydrogenedentes bacterium]|nr:type II toxin-antitoxin system Phd/YefM family antitoxin [Candidatus Hydrogenedentota bacterium]